MNKKMILNGQEISVVSGAGDKDSGSAIPAGVIVMWSGADVPDGWAICDGTNGTPDLRGRFVLGASDVYTMGGTGGEESVTLKAINLPGHRHTIKATNGTGTGSAEYVTYATGSVKNLSSVISLEYGDSLYGQASAHENMPPYYALAYIMKL